MSEIRPNQPNSPIQPHRISLTSLLLRLLVLIIFLLGLLLLTAGRLDWLQAWAFSLAFGGFLLFYSLWSLRHDPEQLAERNGRKSNVKSWDRVILTLYTILLLALLVLAGLDAGRFRWAPALPALQGFGWVALVLAAALVFWTVSVNTFLSRYMRIQDERRQETVTQGPYRIIRHPMYLGVILMMLGLPLALGSTWALIPGASIGVLFIIRTALEDRTLQAELLGYRDYARKVRFRLFPGIW
jgi:protein-S-isoprenylcysteine O-methyltransferase Ste14